MKTSNCWVWFKGSLNNSGFWKEGFSCTFDEKPGVLIESPAFVTCRVPTWRVLTKEPEDLNKSPLIPDKAILTCRSAVKEFFIIHLGFRLFSRLPCQELEEIYINFLVL